MNISAIAAIGKNRELGRDNQLLWHLPEDLKRFKRITSGYPVIMGRKTFESILAQLGSPLPGRSNIVLSSKHSSIHADVVTVTNMREALNAVNQCQTDKVFVIGGAEIYKLFLPLTEILYLTHVDDEPAADTFFPEYETTFKIISTSEKHEEEGVSYRFLTLNRQTELVH